METLRCYAVRRLSPFLGVTQVIEAPAARALTTDGVNWELQMRVERPSGWGSLNAGQTATGYCRYGAWSAAEGLACFPPPPQLDRHAAAASAEAMIGHIEAAQLPFALADSVECWLLDAANGKPCALLHSLIPSAKPPERPGRRWCAALGEVTGISVQELSALEAAVSRAVIPGPVWIERAGDGSGRCRDAPGTQFAAADFPELLLAIPAEPYLAWRAPRLLMLPLSPATRTALEDLAAHQPQDVEHFWRLYPSVSDTGWLNSVRVQARLISAA